MYSTTVNKSVTANLDFNYSNTKTITGAAKYSINQVIPTGTNGAFLNFNFNINSGTFLGLASIGAPIQIRANSTGNPTNVFLLTPGQSIIIDDIAGNVDSFGSGIQSFTEIYVYNSGNSPATLRIDSLFDPTPTL
jgi:hypothetical protein